MLIQASIFGALADRNQWAQFSCIDDEGKLDRNKYAQYMRRFANDGANCTREIPFLVTDGNYKGTEKQRNFLPFMWRNNAYDLDQFNPLYFDNLREMITIANRHNMAFQFSIFDRCHSLNMPDSPWRLNHQGIQGYYDWNSHAQAYVQQVLDTVQDARIQLEAENRTLKILFELENEPLNVNFIRCSIETLKMILDAGFKKDQVEDGVFYLPQQGGKPVIRFKPNGELIRNRLFEILKRARRKAGLFEPDGSDNRNYFVTVHNFGRSPEVWNEMIEALAHSHRMSISSDGEKPKPNAIQWNARVWPIFKAAQRRPNRRKNLERWKFEHLYRGDLQGNSLLGDAIDGVLGISLAYYDVFKEWPENYKQFPHVVEGPQPIEIPNPEPEPQKPSLQEQLNALNAMMERHDQAIEALKQQQAEGPHGFPCIDRVIEVITGDTKL